MKGELNWQNQIENSVEDVRAEIVCNVLAGDETNWDKVTFYCNGGFHRPFRKDLETILLPGHQKNSSEHVIFELNRQGLYDQFPEFLFHKSKKTKHFKSTKELKEEHEFNNRIEENARSFFWPLDHWLLMLRCLIDQKEKGTRSFGISSPSKSLKKFWGIPSFFSKEESDMLISVLPLARDIAGSLEWIEQTFEMILQVPVHVKKKLEKRFINGSGKACALGSNALGISTFCGDGYSDTAYCLQIVIGPLSQNEANSFSGKNMNFKKVEYLSEYFVPIDFDTEIEIKCKSDICFILQVGDEAGSYLGITSILN